MGHWVRSSRDCQKLSIPFNFLPGTNCQNTLSFANRYRLLSPHAALSNPDVRDVPFRKTELENVSRFRGYSFNLLELMVSFLLLCEVPPDRQSANSA